MTGFPPRLLLSDLIERINAAWSVLDICLVIFFVFYVWVNRDYLRGWWSEKTPLAMQAAAAILIFHSGDAVTRSILWWIRHEINRGAMATESYTTVGWLTEVLEFSAIIACIGILCKIRVFAGSWLGRRFWLTSAILALVAAAFTRHLPF